MSPVYNEEEALPEFYRRVTVALADEDYELILVDDGSTDGTSEILSQLGASPLRAATHARRPSRQTAHGATALSKGRS